MDELVQKLFKILEQIEEGSKESPVTIIEKLNLEVEKNFAYNALGLAKARLSNSNTKEYKDGLEKTKKYMEKLKHINF